MNKEAAFKDWLNHYPAHKYSSNAVTGYVHALKNAPSWFNVELDKPMLEIDSIEELQKVFRIIRSVKDYDAINEKHDHGIFSAAVNAYQRYLNAQFDFSWIDFYGEFADKLLAYKDNRPAMIQKIVQVYGETGIRLPKLESQGLPTDMDPFTVFGLFNKGITDSNRIKMIKGLAKAFGVTSKIPAFFQGIPLLNNLSATFYRFKGERGENDIDNLWSLFEAAIIYAAQPTEENEEKFAYLFDIVRNQLGIRWNLTMGLFWIRPYVFLNLDSRTRWFITNSNNTSQDFVDSLPKLDNVPSGSEYMAILKSCATAMESNNLPFSNYPELSVFAWIVSKVDDDFEKNEKIDQSKSGHDDGNVAVGDQNVRTVHYWLYAPGENAGKWDTFYEAGVMGLGWNGLGDLSKYATREEIADKLKELRGNTKSYTNSVLANWQFVHDMMPGDIVFVKKGRDLIIGRGIVASDYFYDEEQYQDGYTSLRNVNWTHKGNWSHLSMGKMPLKTLTDITQYTEYVEQLTALVVADDDTNNIDATDVETPAVTYPVYTPDDFLSEVYMSSADYTALVALLRKKKNVILQGAPGVGKTFTAKRLAYSMMGVKDQDRVAMVQFHQSYSYEDFIMGFRPTALGFELKKGAFYTFCKKAQDDPDHEYFFIIDEINRGNLSKIFGELFMLIENDKRGISMQLLYADEKFAVPSNIMIIGMMNTADRSLAMMDYALRRRFAFFEMAPGFETDGFRKYQEALASEKFDKLIACVNSMNRAIAEDESLGEGFRIGHSHFSNLEPEKLTDADLMSIIRFELIPLLKEYWFDEPQKVKDWTAKLESAVK